MININQKTIVPPNVKWYVLVKLLLLLITLALLSSLGGIALGMGVFWFFGIFIIFPIFIYLVVYYANFSFSIDDSKLNIDSGIIVKKSKSIPFNSIQNINNISGLLMRMFGLTMVNIWTASVSQIEINNRESDNKPDGTLFVTKTDGDWLKDYLLKKK